MRLAGLRQAIYAKAGGVMVMSAVASASGRTKAKSEYDKQRRVKNTMTDASSTSPLSRMVAANDQALVIPATARIEGLVAVPLDVDLWGVVDGEIRCRQIVLHGGAQLLGTIVAERVEVFGLVREGVIAARRIRIGSGCDVEADLYYEELDIEEGGLYEGKSRRHDDPMTLF
ncbi:MAG: polymer-forming cytoskeletal protein, partial [Pseudomonadota bacterium]